MELRSGIETLLEEEILATHARRTAVALLGDDEDADLEDDEDEDDEFDDAEFDEDDEEFFDDEDEDDEDA
jgi:hypothetical protein